MLLELHQLSQSLKSANVSVGQRDDHLVSYSKAKPLFRVTLSDIGEVRTISVIDKDRVATLLKYEVSKGGSRESIPGFNVPSLLIQLGSEQEQKAVNEDLKQFCKRLKRPPNNDSNDLRHKDLNALISRYSSGWTNKLEAIEKCLTKAVEVVAVHLDKAEASEREVIEPLRELLRRAKFQTPELLREQLVAKIRQVIVDGTAGLDSDLLLQFLFMKEGVVLLELAEWDGMPANHESVWNAVNRVLLVGRSLSRPKPPSTELASGGAYDVFGKSYVHTDEKMPERKLPRLGNVKLRSNSKSKPCQKRYGWVEGNSCAVNLDLRSSLADSLVWLTTKEREGKTFRDISNSCGFELPALLLAYPDPLPARPPALAAVLSKAGQQSPTSGEVKFSAVAEQLIKELTDLKIRSHSTNVIIFVLAKRDTARTKLLLSRQFTAKQIVLSVHDWRKAAANTPPVYVRQFGENKRPEWVRCDDIPFPSEVARCLNRVWQRGGERVETVAEFDFGSALTLMLEDGRLLTELVSRSLRLAVTQWIDLLLAMSQAATLGIVCNFSPNEQLLLPPILGLLLFKLGQPKEMYMKATPYWLGRLMAAADKLHRNYCERERDGKIPNGPLIGNAAMSACLENPQAGLARLSERITLYQQVAGESLGAELAEIISHIDADTLPKRATDEHKAQMLLGYLARPDLLRSVSTTEN